MLKPDLSVVDTIEAHLGPVVSDAHAMSQLALIISDPDDKDVRALPLAIDGQLSKDCADLQTE